MEDRKTNWLCVGAVATLLFAVPACWAAQSGTTAQATPAPPVVTHFHLSGELSETPAADPFGLLAGEITSLKDLVQRLNKAGADSRVKAVLLTFDQMTLGSGQREELRQAFIHLKESGKKVYAFAEDMETAGYALLCASDRLCVAPQSTLWLIGTYGESLYVKDLLDKVGVRADFLHMGDYKSAAEMLTRTSPSQPAQDNINWLLDGLYGSLVDAIARARGKTPAQVRDLIDHGPYTAEQAKEKGLIDAIQTRDEFVAAVETDLGGDVRIDNRYGQEEKAKINLASPMGFFSLLSEMFKAPTTAKKSQKDAVAVIYVEGPILPGYSQPTLFGALNAAYSGDIAKALKNAANDNSVKAVVLRVDSPGGSAQASDVILAAAQEVKGQKPLVVSMGNVAASGGYYVSCGADAIFADEATITASIGVVGGKLVTTDLWNRLGVNWVAHKRGANADILSSARPFDDAQRKVIQDYMQQVYEVFKGHVTKGRGDKLRKPIDEIAGGRVYTGKQALDLGLVDQIGGFQQAVEYAAAQVSLKSYDVRVLPEPKDFLTQLMEDLSGEGERPTDLRLSGMTSLLAGYPALGPVLDLLQKAEPQRARVLIQALRRVELFRRESVILMMPFDMVLP